jgi:hypothetical protein
MTTGVKDFEKYRVSKDHKLMLDFFLDEDDEIIGASSTNSGLICFNFFLH